MRALLMSNSTNAGMAMLSHARDAIARVLGGISTLIFVPYARRDWDGYTATVAEALSDLCEVIGAHDADAPQIGAATGYYVGGGNTFRLLKQLQATGLDKVIRQRVGSEHAVYMGASAGSVVVGPSIRTTNDMPIVEPDSFDALKLLGFHLNCHYLDSPAGPRSFMGETRDERLFEFLEENDSQVVCLREGAWLNITGSRAILCGENGGKLFRRAYQPTELRSGNSSADLEVWSSG